MRKRTAMSPRRAATAAAGRGRVSTSPVGRAVRGTTGPVQEEEAQGSAGAVEDSGDGVGIGDDLEDAHAAAAFTAAGDVDGEDAGEELCPRDASWPRRGAGRGSGRVVGEGEVQRELWRWWRYGGLWDDALAQAMVAGEHAVIASHVETGGRDQGAEAGEELVGVHVGVGGAAAPGRLEGDADAAAGERRDGVMGEGRAQLESPQHPGGSG